MLSKRLGSRASAIRVATVSAPAVINASIIVRTRSFSRPITSDRFLDIRFLAQRAGDPAVYAARDVRLRQSTRVVGRTIVRQDRAVRLIGLATGFRGTRHERARHERENALTGSLVQRA